MEAGLINLEDIERRAAVHAALGEPARLAIVEALRLSDQSPSELAHWLSMDSNLLAHHLDVLESVGLIERVVSSGDRRRRYVKLTDHSLKDLFPAAPLFAETILFVCTQNSARSQLAAALWNRKSGVRAESAGTHPAAQVHPMAIEVAANHGIDLSDAAPRSLPESLTSSTLVVTVCDRANEEMTPRGQLRLHWSIPDPTEAGTPEAFLQAWWVLDQRTDVLSERVRGE